MAVTGLAGMYNIKGLDPYLLPPGEIFAGTPAPFRLCVKNNKQYLPSFLISLKSASGSSVTFPLVPKNSLSEASIMLTFSQRGPAPAGLITISSTYPVGFFSRFWTFENSARFIVYPRLLSAGYSDSGKDQTGNGFSLRRERGIEGELEQIYPYSGAEPLRAIHWKLSARSHDLMVKVFGSQSAKPLLIDLAGMPGQSEEERISRAAWLVRRLVCDRPVGLVLGSRVIPAEYGKQHGRLLLTELALYGRD